MKRQLIISTLAAVLSGTLAFAGEPRPTFEVADIQLHTDKDTPSNAQILPGGRVDIRNLNMKQIILLALNVGQGVSDKLIEGIPGWANDVSYDIIAKADAKTPVNTLRVMVQTLLEDRFKMALHREDKVMPVYALVAGKTGPKLKPAAGTDPFACNPGSGAENMIHLVCTNMTIADLVKSLPTFAPRYFDIPILNMTDIKGAYDINLDWYPVSGGGGGGRGGDALHTETQSADIGAVTIFDVVQQLGFKLEKRKEPFPVVIIDHLERNPVEN